MYVDTLRRMKIPESRLRPSSTTFHGIVPGKCAQPLGQIALEVVFGEPNNFRVETLAFEVVDFKGAYHAILGRPAYAKFMARPCYVYLKLKMPGPKGVITITGDFKRSHDCDVVSVDIAESQIAAEEFAAIKESVDNEQAPPSKKPATESTFQPGQDTKRVQVHPDDLAKTVQIGTDLDPK
jgi:hypothetical protein